MWSTYSSSSGVSIKDMSGPGSWWRFCGWGGKGWRCRELTWHWNGRWPSLCSGLWRSARKTERKICLLYRQTGWLIPVLRSLLFCSGRVKLNTFTLTEKAKIWGFFSLKALGVKLIRTRALGGNNFNVPLLSNLRSVDVEVLFGVAH